MDKLNFRDLILRVWVYTPSIGTIGLQKDFSCAQDTGNPRFFGSASVHVNNFWNFSQQQVGYPQFMGLPLRLISVVYNSSYSTF